MDENETSSFKLQKTYPNNLKTRESFMFKSIVLFNRQLNYQWCDLKYERTNKIIKKHCKAAFLYTFTFLPIRRLNNNVKYTVF